MKNRIIGIVILWVIFWSIYGYYYYFFQLNKWNVTIHANVADYTVKFYNQDLKTTFQTHCQRAECELIDIAPFQYTLTIEKEGYKTFSQVLQVQKKTTLSLPLLLEKNITLQAVSQENSSSEKDLKIQELREVAEVLKSYKYFSIENLGYFYFLENTDNSLGLWRKIDDRQKETFIMNIPLVDKRALNVGKLFWDRDSIYISTKDFKYVYDTESGKIDKIYFPQDIQYIKNDFGNYILVNKNGSFIYQKNLQTIEYFYPLKDFVSFDKNSYVGIIFVDEKEKKVNYGIPSSEKSLLVLYTPSNKTMKVLQTLDIEVSKIIKQNDQIFLYDNDGKKYALQNIY